ncbi:MAG: DUF362 domain-containing protein [Thermoplasmatales archaeon]|mgnify:FL=1|nr:DUF362 domain-containing protein [Thermoplasmatales archaeon]
MESTVHFTDMRVEDGDSLMDKLRRLVDAAGIGRMDLKKKFVAIKMHFGEYGNLAFLRHQYAKVISDKVRSMGGVPFLTDCNTLYAGNRKNALEHLETAYKNGFHPYSTGCHVIIGDGLKGNDEVEIPIDGEYVRSAKIGRAVHDADAVITLTHFKCHELSGIGGAIKNLGMGCASRAGKMEQHSEGVPRVDAESCVGCGRCVKECAHGAMSIVDGKARVGEGCVGCGGCISACRFDAVKPAMDQANEIMCRKMAEYAAAAVLGKPNFHVSLIVDVSPLCDCRRGNDAPIIPDVGMLASYDPVALDMACSDLSMEQPVIRGSAGDVGGEGDLFTRVQPGSEWYAAIDQGERVGLGTSKYRIIRVD